MPEKQDNAFSVAWEAPGGLIMVLTRLEEDAGSVLTVSIDGGAVTVFGQKCRYAMTDGELSDETLEMYPDWVNRGALWS